MRPRTKHLGWILTAAATAVAIPAFAYSTPAPRADGTIHAVDNAFVNPATDDGTVTIARGGTVTFDYDEGFSAHNVDFDADPTSCTQLTGTDSGDAPPLPASVTPPSWSGTCRFDVAGEYPFHCDLHAGMTGTVIVQDMSTPTPAGTATATATVTQTQTPTPTVTQTQTPTPTVTQTQTPTPTATQTATQTQTPTATATQTQLTPTPTPSASATASATRAAEPSPSQQGSTPPTGTPPGPAAAAPKLAGSQRGPAIRGAITIARSGSRLQVELVAKRSALGTGRSGQVRVGRFAKTMNGGKASFTVALNAAAKKALRNKGKLKVSVKLTVTPTSGATYTATRSVTVKR